MCHVTWGVCHLHSAWLCLGTVVPRSSELGREAVEDRMKGVSCVTHVTFAEVRTWELDEGERVEEASGEETWYTFPFPPSRLTKHRAGPHSTLRWPILGSVGPLYLIHGLLLPYLWISFPGILVNASSTPAP